MADDKSDSLQAVISVKLNGPNYGYWSDAMTHFLTGKGVWDYVDGTTVKPSDGTREGYETEVKKWKMNNSKIITWIGNSIDLSIAVQLSKFQTAKEK